MFLEEGKYIVNKKGKYINNDSEISFGDSDEEPSNEEVIHESFVNMTS